MLILPISLTEGTVNLNKLVLKRVDSFRTLNDNRYTGRGDWRYLEFGFVHYSGGYLYPSKCVVKGWMVYPSCRNNCFGSWDMEWLLINAFIIEFETLKEASKGQTTSIGGLSFGLCAGLG